VVEFGTAARSRPDLSVSMSYDPAAPPGQVGSVKNRIRAGLLGTNLGNTNTKAGFEEVQKLLASISAAPERVHVVLITDGKPYVELPAAPGAPAQAVPTGMGSQYQREMDALVQALRQRATLDVVGITGNNLDAYWPTWGPYWSQVSGGRAFSGRSGTEISVMVDRILRERLGLPAQTLAGSPYYCPPYLRSITFTVFKDKRGGRAQVKDALGRLVAPGAPGVTYVNEVTYDRITVEEPAPGLWELDRQASKITVDLLYKQVSRQEPKGLVNAQMPVRFGYNVLSERQQPFQPLPAYPVQASLQITDPGGRQTDVPLTYQGQGFFSAGSAFQFPTHGTARLRMTGTTVLPDQTRVTIFAHEEDLQVTNKSLLVLDGGATLPGRLSLLFGRRTVRPLLSVKHAQTDAPARPGDFSTRPEGLLEFRLLRRDGTPLTDWRPMSASGDGFTAEMPVRLPLVSLDWLRRRDEAFAEVRVDEGALHPDFAVLKLRREGTDPPFDRDAALPALRDNPLAVPVVFGESLWTYALILGLAAAALALATHRGYRYARKLCYYVWDTWVWRQRVILVVQPSFQDEITKPITNDYLFSWKGPGVKIKVGEEGTPSWKPAWLKAKRLFRPWAGEVVVKVRYPVRNGKKQTMHSVILTAAAAGREGNSTPLAGVPANVAALVRVKRRGKDSVAQAF
ncbi:MAG TPA: vWA domain-containing protein, partial [Pyrinomonadaceae bacterium]|nr:vWA domain-containing protein [Pyrinomonadaceae bacterium]